MRKVIRKAVIPVAGFGTRLLPASKTMPKELYPLLDKPVIHYAVEEAFAAGIEQILFVTSRGKSALEDYFDHAPELEYTLNAKGKSLDTIQSMMREPGTFQYVRQQQPLGLGHAVWCARHFVGSEPFAVILPDVVTDPLRPCLKGMVDAYGGGESALLAAVHVKPSETGSYGIFSVGESKGPTFVAEGLVEKPRPEEAPSTLAVLGRYVLPARVMELLEKLEGGAGGEIQLTDAIAQLPAAGATIYGWKYEGRHFDCGQKLGVLQATLALGERDPDLAPFLESYKRGEACA